MLRRALIAASLLYSGTAGAQTKSWTFSGTADETWGFSFNASAPGLYQVRFVFDRPVEATGSFDGYIWSYYREGGFADYSMVNLAQFGFFGKTGGFSFTIPGVQRFPEGYFWYDGGYANALTYSGAGTHYNATVYFAASVPEAASWAMLLGGFALAGTALRRRPVKVCYLS